MVIDGKVGYTEGVNISDDKYTIVGTINLDYRSPVHHFENGVWLYKGVSKNFITIGVRKN